MRATFILEASRKISRFTSNFYFFNLIMFMRILSMPVRRRNSEIVESGLDDGSLDPFFVRLRNPCMARHSHSISSGEADVLGRGAGNLNDWGMAGASTRLIGA